MPRNIKDQEMVLAYHKRIVSDQRAKEEILLYIKHLKIHGAAKVSIIELVSDLHLPADQIETIMDSLEGAEV